MMPQGSKELKYRRKGTWIKRFYIVDEDYEFYFDGPARINENLFSIGDKGIKVIHVKNFIKIYQHGVHYKLVIEKGYSWDGATFAIDTLNVIIGCMLHDVFLEIIGLEFLYYKIWKPWTDNMFKQENNKRGMWSLRQKWIWLGVHYGGNPKGSTPYKILTTT